MPEIVVRRTRTADDGAHEHIDLVGYRSEHIEKEPILIPIPRVLQKMEWEMHEFWITVDGEKVPVKAAKCEACGHEPYLKSAKDPSGGNLILQLPEG